VLSQILIPPLAGLLAGDYRRDRWRRYWERRLCPSRGAMRDCLVFQIFALWLSNPGGRVR